MGGLGIFALIVLIILALPIAGLGLAIAPVAFIWAYTKPVRGPIVKL